MQTKSPNRDIALPISTNAGSFLARYSDRGLVGLDFPSAKTQRESPAAAPDAVTRRWHATTGRALLDALAGRKPRALPPLDLSSGTPFQREVWTALGRIPCGETLSYGELAHAIGRPKAVRAVGGACGANPIPVLVPCHRVLAADGRLGGFTAGLDWKRRLLKAERVTLG